MVKLGFVGAGRVGSATAFSCMHMMRPDAVALVDIVENMAVGESLDLAAAAAGLGQFPEIQGGTDYKLLAGSDVVVITAGLARKPGQDRLDLLNKNITIVNEVVSKALAAAPDALLLVVSNPVDVLTYAAWKKSSLDRSRVFGMGSWHDSMRLRYVLGAQGHRARDAWMLGEHGESMLVAQSVARTDGTPDWKKVQDDIRGLAIKIIEKKGATFYAPAVATATMVKSIVENEKRVMPTVTVLDGEFGLKDVALGVPAILGENGVEGVIDPGLDQADLKLLSASGEKLKGVLREIKLVG